MIFAGNKTIEVKEYTNNSVTTKFAHLMTANNHNNVNINGWKLSIALARTLCSNQLNQFEFYFDIIQSILNLSFLVNRQSNNFKLNSRRLNRLRDFSRTNKIGELGQAMTWLYMTEESDFPFIADFGYFCELNNIHIPPNSSTPDFVAQDINRTTNVCLSEAKGKELNSKTSLKKVLKKGLKQCDFGEILINQIPTYQVTKKLVFCSEFSTDSNAENSNLHFTDPIKDNIELNKNDSILKLHFASWFYLIGDFSNVERLIKGKTVQFNEKLFEKIKLENTTFWTIPLFNRFLSVDENHYSYSSIPFYMPFLIGESKIRLGISENVIKNLQTKSERIFELISPTSAPNYETFRDGTLIYNIENSNKRKPNR